MRIWGILASRSSIGLIGNRWPKPKIPVKKQGKVLEFGRRDRKCSAEMSEFDPTELIRFPNRLASIADIVAHTTLVVCALRNQTPQSLAKLAEMPIGDVMDILEPKKKAAKLCAVFTIARVLKVSPETILGFDHSEIIVRRN